MTDAQLENGWTPEQLLSIRTEGVGLLVSAAAGSGKTAVLAERCVHMVCDAEEPCDVDELLVVTFAEAAAAEMKSRIHERLQKRAEQTPSERLTKQLALIDQTQVSTLHSFCFRLLRRHFQLVGLDPAFTLLDEQEAALLRGEVAERLFADRYADDPDGSFARFIDAYGEGEDAGLMHRLTSVHDMLQSVIWPDRWIDEHRRRLRDGAELPLKESKLGREFLQKIAEDLKSLGLQGKKSVAELRKMGGFPKLADYVEEVVTVLRQWWTLLPQGLDVLSAAVASHQFRNAPPIAKDAPGREQALDLMERVRKPMKGGPIRLRLQFTESHWRTGMAAILPHAEVFFSLLEQFHERFAKAKSTERAVDFSDLERFALQVLRDGENDGLRPSAIARAHHEQFRHVLVDEYQDINEVQDAILHLLSRECMAGERGRSSNLFCVGDVKQSIYGFRLADVDRFLGRMEKYRAAPVGTAASLGRVIDLQTNFRSRSPLLSAINALFAKVMSKGAGNVDYDQTQRLSPGPQYPANADESGCFAGAPIELHLLTKPEAAKDGDDEDSAELDRTEREAALVARRIGELLGRGGSPPRRIVEVGKDGTPRARPIKLKDIAILLRSKRFKSEQFAAALQRAGIRAHAESATGFFETVEARDMIALLRLLDNQQQDIPLAAVLRSPLGGLPEPDESLASIRSAYLNVEPAIPFYAAAVRYAKEQSDELAAHLRDFFDSLTEWRTAARRRPLAELIRTIFDDSGYLAFCAGLEDGEQRVANLQFLHEQAAKFDAFHRQGLPRFLAFLESLESDADLGAPSVASEADDVVRIMTIHRAKGLQFPVVIVPDIGKRINVQDCHGSLLVDRTHGLGLDVVDTERYIRYRSLAGSLVESGIRRRILAEELRVLYVAATRAREHLILIGTAAKSAWENWQQQWANHTGVISADTVLSANSMADWIGPVAAFATIDAGTPAFDVRAYTPEESASLDAQTTARPTPDGRLAHFAEFGPVNPVPDDADMQRARKILGRVLRPYAFDMETQRPAAKSVTAIAKSAPSQSPAGPDAPLGFSRKLERPAFLNPTATPLATERGTATHLLLEHFDFRRPGDAAEIGRQIDALLANQRLTPQQAKMVDRNAIAWVLASEAGQLMQQHAARMLREIPVYFPQATASADPLDRTMIRGRLDVFIPLSAEEGGSIIIDYKTDNVDATTVNARSELYAQQMRLYRQAMESITGQPVTKTLLLFLMPRIVVAVE
jgi:ATP-dependent helicase/nuclease subunit A